MFRTAKFSIPAESLQPAESSVSAEFTFSASFAGVTRAKEPIYWIKRPE